MAGFFETEQHLALHTAASNDPLVYASSHALTCGASDDREKSAPRWLSARIGAILSALFGLRNSLAELSDAQLRDAGIPPERAGRMRAADVYAATIANLTAMR